MNWVGKRVLVTGAGGFIGSHLTERLVHEGATVRALVRYNSASAAGWLDAVPERKNIDIVYGDVADADSVRRAANGQDTIFHLAALIGIPHSYDAPRSYVSTNVIGTLNVLQAALAHDSCRVIHTSTSEVYGTARYVPMDEGHPLQGQSPYSATKIAADKLAESFFLSFQLPVVTVRPFNTFGPRQSARAIVPTIVTQCLAGRPLHLGNLAPRRDLNFVGNTVDGFLRAGASDAAVGETINLGTGQETSVGELVELISRLIGRPVDVVNDPARRRPVGSEVERLLASFSRAREILGWSPSVTLEEGLRQTIRWIEQHLDRYRPEQYAV